MESEKDWGEADKLSDCLVDIYNAKVKAGVKTDQILAGLLLGMTNGR